MNPAPIRPAITAGLHGMRWNLGHAKGVTPVPAMADAHVPATTEAQVPDGKRAG